MWGGKSINGPTADLFRPDSRERGQNGAMALRRRPPLLPSLLLLAALAFGIEWLIVTDTEALEAWAEEKSEALNAGDRQALETLLSPDFAYGRSDREAALDLAERERLKRKAQDIEVILGKIEVNGDTARANAGLYATIEQVRYRLTTRLQFQRGPDGWVLLSAEPVAPF